MTPRHHPPSGHPIQPVNEISNPVLWRLMGPRRRPGRAHARPLLRVGDPVPTSCTHARPHFHSPSCRLCLHLPITVPPLSPPFHRCITCHHLHITVTSPSPLHRCFARHHCHLQVTVLSPPPSPRRSVTVPSRSL